MGSNGISRNYIYLLLKKLSFVSAYTDANIKCAFLFGQKKTC